MIRPSHEIEYVWLAREPQDFRKGINGLSIVVEEQLTHDPFSGHLFVFINKGRDKIKSFDEYQARLRQVAMATFIGISIFWKLLVTASFLVNFIAQIAEPNARSGDSTRTGIGFAGY